MIQNFSNPFIILPECHKYKLVFDATVLHVITDVSQYHIPSSTVQVLTPQLRGKVFITTYLSTAYHQIVPTAENQNLVYLIVGNEEYKSQLRFYEKKANPRFFN